MTTVDWLWILHPVLAVVLVYPLLGVVARHVSDGWPR